MELRRRRPPPYIGMIGSKAACRHGSSATRESGISLTVPGGASRPDWLAIGADTPAEIAVSIASEMVAIRRGFHWDREAGGFRHEPERASDLADTAGRLDLWRGIAEAVSEGKATVLATIVERRGSTPRGLGAQMAVFGNGAALGRSGRLW